MLWLLVAGHCPLLSLLAAASSGLGAPSSSMLQEQLASLRVLGGVL